MTAAPQNAWRPKVAALGGGHGLYATLTALKGATDSLTAIVTVADDGGSSGRLRDEMHILPPGDLRMALSALCEDTEWGRTWRDALQHRFDTDGALHGHALGNLLIAGLWEQSGDIIEGLDWVGRLLRSQGRVLPQAAEPLEIRASVATPDGVTEVRGQVAVATAPGRIVDLSIEPASPRVPAETVRAIRDADLVVLGPGSWYTSVLTHFLVPDVREALLDAQRRVVLVLNIAYEDVETAGTARADDLRALRALIPAFRPAAVLADTSHGAESALLAELASWGVELTCADLLQAGSTDRHDTDALRDELLAVAARLHQSVPDVTR